MKPNMIWQRGEREYGMRILVAYRLITISSVKFKAEYQRPIESFRKNRISKAIQKWGYFPASLITLNELYEIIDGQHRVLAAQENDVDVIPACVVTFPDKQKEAAFFKEVNSFSSKQKPVDYWHASYMAGESYATLFYRLYEDKSCLLNNMVAVKDHRSEHQKFNVSDVLSMVNYLVLGIYGPWSLRVDERCTELASHVEYEEARRKINDFLKWFFACFGDDKKANNLPYLAHSIRALLGFYCLLHDKHEVDMPTTVNRLKKFVFTSEFQRMEYSGKVAILVGYYNRGRTKNRIPYKDVVE